MGSLKRRAFVCVWLIAGLAGWVTGKSLSSVPVTPPVAEALIAHPRDPLGPSFDDVGAVKSCHYGKGHEACPCAR